MIPRYPLLLLHAGTCQSCSLFSKWTNSSHPLCQHCPLGEISAPLVPYNPSFYSSKSWFLCPFASDVSRATLIFSPFTPVVTISWTHLGIGQLWWESDPASTHVHKAVTQHGHTLHYVLSPAYFEPQCHS